MKSLINVSFCMLALSIFPSTCFGKKPEPPDPKFLAIDQIVVLPVVDARAGEKRNVNFESLRKHAEDDLKSKHYSVSLSDNNGITGDIHEEDLNDAKPDWVKRLGPPESRWVMVIGLSDSQSKVGKTGKVTFGNTTNVELVGYLFDKQDGSVVWKGTGVGQSGSGGGLGTGGGLVGGLVGMGSSKLDKPQAFNAAVNNLLKDIPKLPKK